jgi:hypothetical protein
MKPARVKVLFRHLAELKGFMRIDRDNREAKKRSLNYISIILR